jgi:hypothetical protein
MAGVYSQVVLLTERLNRFRSLTDEEVEWLDEALRLEAAIERRSQNRGKLLKPWKRDDIAKLKRYLAQDMRVPQFAPQLGRTPAAVHRKMRKLGLRCTPIMEEAAE